jgi:predicted O-linked N-acetylglucosamine transferase (SPINDLY family)
VWLRLLQRLPHAVLWLVRSPTGEAADRLLQRAHVRSRSQGRQSADGEQAAGVGRQVVFADPAPYDAHVCRGFLADAFLDTMQYGAHSTGNPNSLRRYLSVC